MFHTFQQTHKNTPISNTIIVIAVTPSHHTLAAGPYSTTLSLQQSLADLACSHATLCCRRMAASSCPQGTACAESRLRRKFMYTGTSWGRVAL